MSAACLATVLGGVAFAGDIPTEPGAFSAAVVKQFQAAMPGATVEIAKPLALTVKPAGGGAFTASLETVHSACRRAAETCDQRVATYVRQMSAAFTTGQAPLDSKLLRVVVRPVTYVDQIKKGLAGRGEPVAESLQDGFWVIGVADEPTAIRTLSSRDIEPLGLSVAEALAAGKKNMAAEMRAHLHAAAEHYSSGVAALPTDPYQASLFAFPKLWAPLARKLDGNLLVSVPASDVVLFADGRDPGGEAALQRAALAVLAKANRPFLPAVFRWSKAGWTFSSVPPPPQ